ncbi:bifunctional 3-(3-hydroxy-phenyl)propionate/3-hydroxycinnamic acid hydroxylase [Streptomyces sp. NPDC056716]|uniref:bifunctional 3-(3-hydroxy-phenyl)propionate/3-hydroxycinnamic acid hydroxylase n=1 Tax=unclassified Streptomyces TaxID=2593676 RepID=UPI00369A0453
MSDEPTTKTKTKTKKTTTDPASGRPHPDADVLIAGAGPVGQVLALLLARQGLRVSVVERWAQPYPLPRAVTMSHDVQRILRQLGLGTELDPMLEPWGLDGQRFSFADGSGLIVGEPACPPESESGHARMSGFSQPDLETLLERRVRAEPRIAQYRGHTLDALTDDGDRVSARIRPHTGLAPLPDGVPRTLRAAYAVGCDGANSTVRALLGLELTDLGFSRDWLVVDVVPHAPLAWPPYACQLLGPGRPTTLVPAGPGRRRWEFMILPTDEQESVDTDENAWKLLAPFGVHPGNAELVRHARYTFRGRWADRWNHGRVVLAGDAAHQMPPFTGQGLNSGIRDAANLAWRLALLIRGQGDERLLADYSAERAGQLARIIEDTVHLGRLICMTDPAECARRDALLGGNAGPVHEVRMNWTLRGGTLQDDGIGGGLGLQARVGAGTRTGPLDEVIAPGTFLLLGRDEDPLDVLSPAHRTAWHRLGGRSAHFGPGGLTDPEGAYAAWFGRLPASVVVIRPDFHLFGGARGPHAADDLVHHLTRHVLSGRAPHRWR